MSRLPQLLTGQQAIPWYQSGFFGAGVIIAFIGLIILIAPPKLWKRIGNSVFGFPHWIYETYVWRRYQPLWDISQPKIEMLTSVGIAIPQYKAHFSVSIKSKGRPLRVNFNSARVAIEQKTEWRKDFIVLGNLPAQDEIELKPGKEGYWNLEVSTPFRDGYIYNPPDLQQPYQWGIQGIYVTLPRKVVRELHKGIYKKPTGQIFIGPL
ncbi:MAG TPA: hypothetical protein VEG28_02655 [Dehalococcoidia bacterium]|nr:hypothetical protein [Dehalococcoidia bacterium]